MNDEMPIDERLPYPTKPMYFPDGTSVEEFIIPDEDKDALKNLGVVGVFGPGTTTEEIRDFINNLIAAKDSDA